LEYRGIELSESVNYYNKDKRSESVNQRVKNSLDRLIDLSNFNNHKILSKYYNENTKILIDFNCNHQPHWITPAKYKQGRGCPTCGNKIISEKQNERAKNEFLLLVNNKGHSLKSEYIEAKSKVLIDFNCGHKPHWVSPNNYKKEMGSGCPKCSGKCPEQAKENLIKLIELNSHIILSEYKNGHTKVLIDFNCGHNPHWILPSKYKDRIGCPLCSESKGEKRIRKWLEYYNLNFESQKEFEGLLGLGSGKLSYDFYLTKLNTLIEYQGEFHDGTAYQQTKKEFKIQQEHDRRKREYAKFKNIELLEIWYWDYENIESILEEYFKKEVIQ
jgi:hypothetical protein